MSTTTPSNKTNNTHGKLYVIQTRNCLESHKHVYKLGRSGNLSKRVRQYPLGSVVVFSIDVNLMVDAETMLLALCRIKFKQRRDFGVEYFEGDLICIMRIFLEVADQFRPEFENQGVGPNCVITEESSTSIMLDSDLESLSDDTMSDAESMDIQDGDVEELEVPHEKDDLSLATLPKPAATDPTFLLLRYIHDRMATFVGPVPTSHLLDDVVSMYREAGCKTNLSLKSLVGDLKRYFKCTETPSHVFSDGSTGHATSFPINTSCVMQELPRDAIPPANKVANFPTNKVEEYLAKGDEKRGYTIRKIEGATTWAMDFKERFEAKMNVPYVEDPVVFAAHGYEISSKSINVCLHCKRRALVGCCPQGGDKKRGKKFLVFNMEMLPFVDDE